jgi:phosphate transport system permease protein
MPEAGGAMESEHTRQVLAAALGRQRKGRQVLDKIVESIIFSVSATAVAVIFLIFLFVARESLPVLFQRTTTAGADAIIEPHEMDSVEPAQLAHYLGLPKSDLSLLDAETIRELLEDKSREFSSAANDPDLEVNSVSYAKMFLPHAWRGYDRPRYVWQPESLIPKFNVVPLIVGTLKCTIVALLFAVPLALLAAIYVSQMAPFWVRQVVKPLIELLAGIPSVVLGFFALMVLATWMQQLFQYSSRLNALVAGVALGLAVLPVVFTIAEDALRAVPNSYKEAAIALGASRFEVTLRVVVPAAMPGIFAAIVLGFGRAIGETMIVLMASGNAWLLTWNPADSARTLTASIAAELAETVRGGHHYQVLFFLGTMLFAITFLTNYFGSTVIQRMREKMTGKRR